MANGGLTNGPSHSKGGIKMKVKSTGQQIEVEGGEGIINKHVMSSKKKVSYKGRKSTPCEIASDLNQQTGNGVQFDCAETDNTDMTPTDSSTGFSKGGKTPKYTYDYFKSSDEGLNPKESGKYLIERSDGAMLAVNRKTDALFIIKNEKDFEKHFDYSIYTENYEGDFVKLDTPFDIRVIEGFDIDNIQSKLRKKLAKGGKTDAAIKWEKNIGEEGWSSNMKNEAAYDNYGGYISEDGDYTIFQDIKWDKNRQVHYRGGDYITYYKGIPLTRKMVYGNKFEDETFWFPTLKDAKNFVNSHADKQFSKGGGLEKTIRKQTTPKKLEIDAVEELAEESLFAKGGTHTMPDGTTMNDSEHLAKGGKVKVEVRDVYDVLSNEIYDLQIHEETNERIDCGVRDWGDWEHDYDDYERDEDDGDFEDDDQEILSEHSERTMSRLIQSVRKQFPTVDIEWDVNEKNWIDFTISVKTKEEIAAEKKYNKAVKLISKELKIPKDKALKIVEDLFYAKRYYEKNKDSRWNEVFSIYNKNGRPTRIEFNNTQEIFDFISNKDFVKSVYNGSRPIHEVSIELYKKSGVLRIKYNTDDRPILPDGKTDWSNKGKVLRANPYYIGNIDGEKDFTEKLSKVISDFIISYKIYVLEEKPTPVKKSKKVIKPINLMDELDTLDFGIGGSLEDPVLVKLDDFATGGFLEDYETEYKGTMIMHFEGTEEWYVQDRQFNSLAEAQDHIDKGSPMDARTINAYRHGAFAKGGDVLLISQFKKGDTIKGKTIDDIYLDKNYTGIYFTDGSYERYTKDSVIKRKDAYAKGGDLTPEKAQEMLDDGYANGVDLTDKQKGYFHAVADGEGKFAVGGRVTDAWLRMAWARKTPESRESIVDSFSSNYESHDGRVILTMLPYTATSKEANGNVNITLLDAFKSGNPPLSNHLINIDNIKSIERRNWNGELMQPMTVIGNDDIYSLDPALPIWYFESDTGYQRIKKTPAQKIQISNNAFGLARTVYLGQEMYPDAWTSYQYSKQIERFLSKIASPLFICKQTSNFISWRIFDGFTGSRNGLQGFSIVDWYQTDTKKNGISSAINGVTKFFIQQLMQKEKFQKLFIALMPKQWDETTQNRTLREYLEGLYKTVFNVDGKAESKLVQPKDFPNNRAILSSRNNSDNFFPKIFSTLEELTMTGAGSNATDEMKFFFEAEDKGEISNKQFNDLLQITFVPNTDFLTVWGCTPEDYKAFDTYIKETLFSDKFVDELIDLYNRQTVEAIKGRHRGMLSPSYVFNINKTTKPGAKSTESEIIKFKSDARSLEIARIQTLMGIIEYDYVSKKQLNDEIRIIEDDLDIDFNLKGAKQFNLKNAFKNFFDVASKEYVGKRGKRTEALAPNGDRSLLTTKQYDTTRTRKFLTWFGDWEKSYESKNYNGVSKCINPDGEPKVVYHGGVNPFEFTKFGLGEDSSWTQDAPPVVYFAEDESYSDWFGSSNKTGKDGNDYTFEFFLSCRNPIDLVEFGYDKMSLFDLAFLLEDKHGIVIDTKAAANEIPNLHAIKYSFWMFLRHYKRFGLGDMFKKFNELGYDSIRFVEDNPSSQLKGKNDVTVAWVIFDRNQAKLSDGRNKGFSGFTDDFRFKQGGDVN